MLCSSLSAFCLPAASLCPSFLARRQPTWLRHLSLLLALCCFWSFAGAGIALAAAPQQNKQSQSKAASSSFLHAPVFSAPASPFQNAAPTVLHSAPPWKLTQAAPMARPKPSVSSETMSETMLDEVGRLAHAVPASQPLAWRRELAAHPVTHRAALLHLWLGEWQMAANEQPGTARRHFRQVQALVPRTDRLYGLAAYDAAVALMFQGAYQDAVAAFHVLVVPQTAGRGYAHAYAALWERHAAACAGYHAQRSAAGIPEPPRLDPRCGAAGLASSLRALALPYDVKTVLAACRVTGRGSNMQDLLNAAPKLHVHAVAVTADDVGLKLLPKPLIAYVEHDHFISIVKADSRGVSYLCSDCGMWPGGRVNLTWAQWHLLEATLYVTVTKPGSTDDRMMAAVHAPAAQIPALNSPLRVSFTGSLSQLHRSLEIHLPAMARLRGHVLGHVGTNGAACSYVLSSQHCKFQKPPVDSPGTTTTKKSKPNARAASPGDGDPVNLATGEEEYAPPDDLSIYNPHGPSVSWGRTWQSLRPAESAYQSDDFGPGWSQPYNLQVSDPTVTVPTTPQALSGVSSSFAATGSDAPGGTLTWAIVLNGATTVATSANPGAWAVAGVYGPPASLTVTVPAGTSATTGFEVRYNFGSSYNASAYFNVVSTYSVSQGGAAQFSATGTNTAPDGWDIYLNGVKIAWSTQPGGWQVVLASQSSAVVAIQTPLNAALSSGYEVRCGNYTGAHSAFFTVGASRFTGATGTANYKYVILPNGGRVQFTAPSVPTAGQPKVNCAVEAGMPLLVEWDYDAASPGGHYTVTMADRTRWITSAPAQEIVSTGTGYPFGYNLIYLPTQIVDRNGNGLNLAYGYTNPADGWPLLTGIADANTGTTLLSLNRTTNGGITSVSDAYGRSVVYHQTSYNGIPGVDQVSQIIPTAALGQFGLPSRYGYGYTLNTPDGISNLRLHTISIPSSSGTGISTATINYDGQAFVSSLVDGNGNTRTYSSYGPSNGVSGNYGTQVTVTDAGSHLVYSYAARYGSNMNVTALLNAQGVVTQQYVYADPNDPNGPSAVSDGNAVGQVAQNGSATLTITGADGPTQQGSGNWDILSPSGSFVANSSTPGWSVTYSPGSLLVSVPAGAALGSGYEVRDQYGYVWSAYFSIIAAGSTPKQPTKYTWDSYGNLLSETSPRNTTTTYTYSYTNFALGELTQVQEGSKSPTTYAYFEPSGLIQSVTAPKPGTVGLSGPSNQVVASYTYDTTSQGSHGLGNLLTVIAPGNNAAPTITTTLNYTTDGAYSQAAAMGQPVTVTDNLGKVTHLRYDAQGNTLGVKDALGNETDMTYDIRNAGLQTILPFTNQSGPGHAGSQATYLYAEPSSFATTQWPAVTLQYGPVATNTSYDESANAIRQVVNTYGVEGELLHVSGSTEPVTYAYDALYRLSTLKDAANHTTSYFYNAAGYLYQTVYPGAQATPPAVPLAAGSPDTTTYPTYDADGNLLSRTDGNNKTTTYIYSDPESKLTDIMYPPGTIGSVHLSYDSYGRRGNTSPGAAGMTDVTGSQAYTYDDDDNLISKTVSWVGVAGSKILTYGLNPNGSRQSMNADGRSFAYTYDGVGRLTGLTNDTPEMTSWTYFDNGWLHTKTLANGVVTTYTLDQQGRLRDLVNKTGSGTSLSDFAVPAMGGYDGVGSRLSLTATLNPTYAPASYSGTTGDTYDYGSTTASARRSQVTQETSTRGGSYTNTFGYDGGTSGGPGNPTSFKGVASTFNSDNQVTNIGYGYDGNGSPTTYKTNALTFDPENRMTAYGSAQTDGYSGDGLRVWKQTGTGMTRTYFLYDGSQPVCEYGSTGTLTATNTFGADGLISRRNVGSSATTFYTFDERGNVSQRLTTAGSVSSTDLYDTYGSRTGTVAQPDPFGYEAQAGYYTDTETGLILCTHRFYDPAVGRFATRDPMGYGGGVNLYGYCQNDPVNGIDPIGYDGFGAGVIGGIVGIVVVVVLTGGVAIVPVIIGGVVGGAIGGYFFGGTPNHTGDAGEGAIGGGFVSCIVIFRGRPPMFPPGPPPPPEPPIPPDKVWPPPPNFP